MQDLFAALINLVLVDPLQHEIAKALAATRAPQEVVVSVATCATAHGSQIVDRALGDPWWAASNAFGVWVGLAEPYTLLVEAAPECAAAVEAVRPFFEAQ
jgi:hypothetical protein